MLRKLFQQHKCLLLILYFMIFACVCKAQAMKYESSEVKNFSTNTFKVVQLTIILSGKSDPLSLTKLFIVAPKKIGRQSFSQIKVYCSGHDSTYSNAELFGLYSGSDSLVSITGSKELSDGKIFFWITGDQNLNSFPSVSRFDLGIRQYRQVWADEFNSDTINSSNWRFEKGFIRNHELQWYQPDNAICKNGILTIEGKKEFKENPGYDANSYDWRRIRKNIEYTSACLLTSGKQQWQYGRFEMRARIDTANGYWPAWWTLGVKRKWPANGEIDIMEFYKGKLLANIAVADSNPSKAFWFSKTKDVTSFSDPHWSEEFHIWRMDWDENGIGLYVDDMLMNYQPQTNLYNRGDKDIFPFRQEHYMLLNLAIGGDSGGDPRQTSFPRKFEIDYVRVSQKIAGAYTIMGTYRPTIQIASEKNFTNLSSLK